MADPIRIFTDRSLVPEGGKHVVMLFPFWGKNPEDPRDPSSGRYDRYAEMGRTFFDLAPLEEADLAVYPVPWEIARDRPEAVEQAHQFSENAARCGKRTVVFFWCDSEEAVPIPHAIVLRTTLHRSKRLSNESVIPHFSEDPFRKPGGPQLALRPKLSTPTIGFCGYAETSSLRLTLHQKVKGALNHWIGAPTTPRHAAPPHSNLVDAGHAARAQAVNILHHSSHVRTHFILRSGFLGGLVAGKGPLDYARLKQLRGEFFGNLLDSDYGLCTPCSYRVYEVFSCGRIPVMIDTGGVFPYEEKVEWSKYGVWVDERDIPHIAEIVADFHARLSDRDFKDIQATCRSLWERYLSPEGFFANMSVDFGKEVDH